MDLSDGEPYDAEAPGRLPFSIQHESPVALCLFALIGNDCKNWEALAGVLAKMQSHLQRLPVHMSPAEMSHKLVPEICRLFIASTPSDPRGAAGSARQSLPSARRRPLRVRGGSARHASQARVPRRSTLRSVMRGQARHGYDDEDNVAEDASPPAHRAASVIHETIAEFWLQMSIGCLLQRGDEEHVFFTSPLTKLGQQIQGIDWAEVALLVLPRYIQITKIVKFPAVLPEDFIADRPGPGMVHSFVAFMDAALPVVEPAVTQAATVQREAVFKYITCFKDVLFAATELLAYLAMTPTGERRRFTQAMLCPLAVAGGQHFLTLTTFLLLHAGSPILARFDIDSPQCAKFSDCCDEFEHDDQFSCVDVAAERMKVAREYAEDFMDMILAVREDGSDDNDGYGLPTDDE